MLLNGSYVLWGRGKSNPRKTPNFGDGVGDRALKSFRDTLGTGKHKSWGFSGAKTPKPPKFWGEVGARALKRFGDNLGTGQRQLSEIFWGKIPKNPQISEWGRGMKYRGFSPH